MRIKASWTSRRRTRKRRVAQVGPANPVPGPGPSQRSTVVRATQPFHEIVERERARSDRGGLGFSLLVFDVDGFRPRHLLVRDLEQALIARLRPTDEVGWLDDERIGILLPGTSATGAHRLAHDVCEALGQESPFPKGSVYSYPLDWRPGRGVRLDEVPAKPGRVSRCTAEFTNEVPLPNHLNIGSTTLPFPSRVSFPVWKRTMDIAGAAIGLVVLSPLMVGVSALIKVVSPGPALFRQRRIGMMGKPFTMFKFRTMQLGTDSSIHERHIADLIEDAGGGGAAPQKPMRKLENHPSMIPFGRLLRKTCLDEIPQLINVLRGEMSLIGPRPPLAYEVQRYPEWCFTRFGVPPGMTGLWQVSGKNRLCFDEMMRLDTRYAREMSLWLDLLVLLKTPFAIGMEIVNAIARIVFTERRHQG